MNDGQLSRLARLTAIITDLQSKLLITATFLANKYNVSVRTIYRDIRSLEQSGIPIYMEEGKGYSLMEGYQLPPVVFTEEEANAIMTAEQFLIKNKDASLVKHFSNAITKIKSVLRYHQKGKADLIAERVYVSGNNNLEKSSDYLMKIQSALVNNRLLEINYNSSKKVLTKRMIEPFALYSNNQNWLLVAFCRTRNEFRNFRVDYIQKLVPQNEFFEPHKMTIVEYFEKYIKPQNNP